MDDAARSTGVNVRQALLNPGSIFESPEAVVLHEGLSKQQKTEILRRWSYDASENCVAVEEGMANGESDLLRRILLALETLSDSIDVERVGPTKQHGIPRSD
jgi:hypothetical protein